MVRTKTAAYGNSLSQKLARGEGRAGVAVGSVDRWSLALKSALLMAVAGAGLRDSENAGQGDNWRFQGLRTACRPCCPLSFRRLCRIGTSNSPSPSNCCLYDEGHKG